MTGPTIVKTLHMGKGITLHLIRDDSLPEDSLDRWHTKAICTGEGEPFEVPLHWHKKHTEHFTVDEGRIEVTIDGVKRLVSAGESVAIPALAVHGFKGFGGERLVIRERFFNDLLSEGWPAPFWTTMRSFYDGDGYPALGLHKSIDVAFVTVLGGIAKLFLPAKQRLE